MEHKGNIKGEQIELLAPTELVIVYLISATQCNYINQFCPLFSFMLRYYKGHFNSLIP